jgi:hypothetical protein
VITIFGTTYFTIGAGLVVLVLAAPLLFWFSRWLWRPNVEDKPWRVQWLAIGGTTLGLLLLVAVGLFWDVYLIGQRAKELCRETGLVVYRKASAESFLGDINIEYWSRDGFKFLEYRINEKILRISFNGDNSSKEWVQVPASQFELVRTTAAPTGERMGSADQKIRQHVSRLIERSSGDILGQLVEYSFRPGWLDRTAISITGFTANPWRCGRSIDGVIALEAEGDRINEHDLVRAVLTPPR